MFARFDRFAAKRLFHPPIIRLCQMLNCGQYAFSRHALVVFWALFSMVVHGGIIVQTISLCILAVAMWAAHHFGNKPNESLAGIRALWWVCLVLFDLLPVVLGVNVGEHLVWLAAHIAVLASEYASTIKTIPPLETKQKEKALAHAKA